MAMAEATGGTPIFMHGARPWGGTYLAGAGPPNASHGMICNIQSTQLGREDTRLVLLTAMSRMHTALQNPYIF